MSRITVAVFLLLGACGGSGAVDSSVEPLGAINDRADRGCQVVLRDAAYLVDGRSVGFAVTVELGAQLVAQSALPFVLYQTSGGAWQEAQAYPDPSGTTIGSGARAITRFRSDGDAQAIAFAKLPDGSRVFDHNRFPGDFETAHLSARPGWQLGADPSVCVGPRPRALLDFQLGPAQVQRGAIVRGGRLEVSYALDRLTTCRGTHNGFRFWSMDAWVRFSPGGQTSSGTVVASNGVAVLPALYSVDVPRDASQVEIWFRNASVPSCEGYDSNFRQNYRFPVEAGSPSAIEWLGDQGSSTSRACQHDPGVPDPIVLDEYLRERACLFVDADVWAPGVTDGSAPHPEWIFAQVEQAKDGHAPTTDWLVPEGRVGNNARYRFSPDALRMFPADWTTFSYTFRFSTDGNSWLRGPTRTIRRTFPSP